jgi:hypothetical protein
VRNTPERTQIRFPNYFEICTEGRLWVESRHGGHIERESPPARPRRSSLGASGSPEAGEALRGLLGLVIRSNQPQRGNVNDRGKAYGSGRTWNQVPVGRRMRWSGSGFSPLLGKVVLPRMSVVLPLLGHARYTSVGDVEQLLVRSITTP